MITIPSCLIVTVLATAFLDALPCHSLPSAKAGLPRDMFATALFAILLIATGNPVTATAMAATFIVALVVASILKERTLGEPLVFSDLAVAASFLRYPRFYLEAIPPILRFSLPGILAAIIALPFIFSTSALAPRAVGLAILAAIATAFFLMWRLRWRDTLMPAPALLADIQRHGLLATLAVYTLRWRSERDPLPMPPLPARDATDLPLLVVIQCESFADPTTLVPSCPLPPARTFERLSRDALLEGRLDVLGFGAYTMRTEYGVLFGRDEAELAFRRYDPYLTAHGETSFSLAAHFRNLYRERVFLHPHDMRFYGRDRLMPACGFNRVISTESFTSDDVHGPYVADRALGRKLTDMLTTAGDTPTFIYAVTMENHGPWQADRVQAGDALKAYDTHLRSSDALLAHLDENLSTLGRNAVLVFFGDHRPSIPGVTDPYGPRDTPYLIRRYGKDRRATASERRNITPAGLHREIVKIIADAPELTH